MSWYAVETAMVHVVKTVFPSMTVAKGYSGAAEPVTPYAWVDVLTFDPNGTAQVSTLLDDTGNIQTIEHYVTRCRFTFVGTDKGENHGGDLATAFSTALSNPSMLDVFETEKVSFLKKDPIRRVPKLRETAWYNTYVIEVVFAFQLINTEENDGITTVQMTGNYIAGEDTIIQEITIPE